MKSGQGAEAFDEKGQEACDGNKKCGGKAESGRKAQKGKFFGEASERWLQNTSRRQLRSSWLSSARGAGGKLPPAESG